MSTKHHHHHDFKYEQEKELAMKKPHNIRRRRKLISNTIFTILCVIAVAIIAAVVWMYTNE